MSPNEQRLFPAKLYQIRKGDGAHNERGDVTIEHRLDVLSTARKAMKE